jgi:pyruvate dehydrogenase E2 component (dihydrolipoamide acetyltransferase)
MAQAIRAVTMPKWGIEMTEGTINQWSIQEGQPVEKGEPLLEVETEKIVNTVESPAAGVLRRIVAGVGEVKPVGSLIAVLADTSVSDTEIASFIQSFRGASVSFEPDAPAVDSSDGAAVPAAASDELRISPIARRLAENLGVDISQVKGSGRNGRISKEDVEAYVARVGGAGAMSADAAAPALSAAPVAGESSGANPVTRLKLSATRATIARRLLESKQTIPHFRLAIDVEVDSLQQHRRSLQSQARVSLNDMLLRACGLALVRHPILNAQFDGTEILQFAHADIAVAVATDNGLITPIVRNVDRKPLLEIARETADLAERARRNALTREEIMGGTFTLSNLGMYGLASFDAIINPPQVAILAVGAAREVIVARNAAPAVAQVVTLTLSADHRVIDGAQGAAFLATLKDLICSAA